MQKLDNCNYVTIWIDKRKMKMNQKVEEKEAIELKYIYNHPLDRRTDIKKSVYFNVEDVFGDIPGKDGIFPDQITKLNDYPEKVTSLFFFH